MIKSFLLIFFLISACSFNTNNDASNNFNYSDGMTFDEYKQKLEQYAKNKPFPKIDD